jgi:unsaturated chondroitin disaccharide hydrolase
MRTQTTARGPAEPLSRLELFSTPPEIGTSFWQKAMDYALSKIGANIPAFAADRYPASASTGNVYPAVANVEWTTSFWPGLLWLAWEAAGDRKFRDAAAGHLADFRARLDTRTETATHDLGFLYSLSCVPAWKLEGDESARATALKAADLLMLRYFPKAGVVQAWGDLNDPAQRGRIIIDCAMNLPLLHWASEETRNPYYREAALSHLRRANESLVRPDWSSFHTYYFDTETGAALRGITHQGYSNDSCWARGQAWGILGNALCWRYVRDPSYLETARGLAHYFLNRLPEDLVAYWDLVFTGGPQERDSSAAAIAACGLMELAGALPLADPFRRVYENAALHLLAALTGKYTSAAAPRSNAILLHGVYNKPGKAGVDEAVIWGDYFYVEALVRVLRGWKPYW